MPLISYFAMRNNKPVPIIEILEAGEYVSRYAKIQILEQMSLFIIFIRTESSRDR